jgi:hypothetical protein
VENIDRGGGDEEVERRGEIEKEGYMEERNPGNVKESIIPQEQITPP